MKNIKQKIIVFTSGIFLLGLGLLGYQAFNGKNISKSSFKRSLISGEAKAAGANERWLDQVIKGIRKDTYKPAKEKDGTWVMINHGKGLKARFFRDNIVVMPQGKQSSQANAGAGKQWKWQTAFFGRSGDMQEPGKRTINITEGMLEYRYNNFTEWYKNKPEGLEQGFTINKRPRGNPGQVRIASRPTSLFKAKLVHQGESIEFYDQSGKIMLRYAGLKAWDAKGKELSSTISIENDCIVLSINDCQAEYPITIDPLITTPVWEKEGNKIDAYYGYSVSTAGDVNGDGFSDIIVGAYGYDTDTTYQGQVNVYLGSKSGPSLTPSWTKNGTQSMQFGSSVSSAGDVNGDGYGDIIIGSSGYSDLSLSNKGRVDLFLGSSSGLASNANWSKEGDVSDAFFGSSVDSAGDVNGDGFGDVIIGGYGYNNYRGRAYVYLGSGSTGTGISANAPWMVECDQAEAFLGYSLSSAGDVNGDGYSDIIVGAYRYDHGETDEGRAYVYLGSASTSNGISNGAPWILESNIQSANFGTVVNNAGDVNGDGYGDVIISAGYLGRVYVYRGSAAGFSDTPDTTIEAPWSSPYFACSITNAGDINSDGYSDVIIGSFGYTNGQTNEGAAYIYFGSSAGLPSSPDRTLESNWAWANFGSAVAGAGDVNDDGFSDIIVGAPNYSNGENAEGKAYVYMTSEGSLSNSPNWSIEGNQDQTQAGYHLVSAGDINGDGYEDIMVGLPYFDTGIADAGQILIFYGHAAGPSSSADQSIDGNSEGELFGYALASAGDINGDGYGDIIIGAPNYSNHETNEGRIYVYYGSASGINIGHAFILESNQPNARMGFAVASAGDVNGDGYSDVLYSAPFAGDQGRVYLLEGGVSGLSSNPNWTVNGSQFGSRLGYALASAGDVNGDGFGDVIIGDPYYDHDQTDEGRVIAYYGSNAGLAAQPAWSQESNQALAQYGFAVASAGDVNGDGYSDVAVSANLYDKTQSNEGRVDVYYGGPSGLGSVNWTKYSGVNGAQLGTALACAGDVNNDGYDDLMIGAYLYGHGRAYIYYGASGGLAINHAWMEEGGQSGAEFGYALASAGDVNGDGYADILVGAPKYTNGEANEGAAFLYLGNEGRGLPFRPRQLNAAGSQLIGPSGLASASSTNSDFVVRLFAKSSQGKTRAKLQVQVAPVGQALATGPVYTQSNYTATGLTGSDLSYTVGGLNLMQAYKWRARVLYDPNYSGNGLLHSKWVKPANADLSGIADFRNGPVPQATATPTPLPTGTKTSTPTITPTCTITMTPIVDFGGHLISKKYVYTAPNPVRGDNANFTVYTKAPCTLEVQVYTSSHGKVMTFDLDCPTAGFQHKQVYMGNLANGVYLFLVKADDGQGHKERLVKKIALIK